LRPRRYTGSRDVLGVHLGHRSGYPQFRYPQYPQWPNRREIVSLTDTAIKRSRPAEKPCKLADGKGLHLLVNPSGSKLWRWKYRHDGKEKLMPFGAYPDVSLADSRVRLAEARRMLAAGIDPMAQRKAAKEAGNEASENPFSAIAALWFDHWKVNKSSRHVTRLRRRADGAETCPRACLNHGSDREPLPKVARQMRPQNPMRTAIPCQDEWQEVPNRSEDDRQAYEHIVLPNIRLVRSYRLLLL